MTKLPPWIRVRLSSGGRYADVHDLLRDLNLHTVCQSAHCPNQGECFNRGTATFLILGNACTRDCAFCAVEHGAPTPVDPEEPLRVGSAAGRLELKHVVVTSVTRDDLPDGGAAQFAATIRAIRAALHKVVVEVLIPDFGGSEQALGVVLEERPDVLNHNVETVRRLQQTIRPAASYERSLGVLRFAAAWEPRPWVKSGLMVGLGETDAEVEETMRDLLAAGCDLLTIGQYLAPSPAHAEVQRFVEPAGFEAYGRLATELGFKGVASGPLVRSSYRADQVLAGRSVG